MQGSNRLTVSAGFQQIAFSCRAPTDYMLFQQIACSCRAPTDCMLFQQIACCSNRLHGSAGFGHCSKAIKASVYSFVSGDVFFLEYTCGSNQGWSDLFSFTAMRSGTNWSPRFALYGDLGNINAQSLPRLQLETEKDMYDAILHIGQYTSPLLSKCNCYPSSSFFLV